VSKFIFQILRFRHERIPKAKDLYFIENFNFQIRADAELDAAGRIIQVGFSWDRLGHKLSAGMTNTVFKSIRK